MTDDANDAELIEAYFAAWNARDPARLGSTFGPSGTYSDPTTSTSILGRDLARVVEPLLIAFPNFAYEHSRPVGADGKYAVEWVLRGENLGELRPGVNPTGLS